MSDAPLEERLAAVERALTEGDGSPPDPAATDRDLAGRVETLEDSVADLEAAVQAVRGYVGSVKHVNDEVEQRADAAMAKVQSLERALADGEDGVGVPATELADGGCPRCADVRPGRRSFSGAENTGSLSRAGSAGSLSRAGSAGSLSGDECSDTLSGDERSDSVSGDDDSSFPSESADHGSSTGDRSRERARSLEPGHGRVGHRRLEEPDEAEGLLARIVGVL